jgi:hypothetical protein
MKRLPIILIFILVCNIFSIIAQEKEEKLFLTGYIKNLHELSFIDKLEQL